MLGEMAIMILALLQDGNQGIGLTALALQDDSQLQRCRERRGLP